MVGNISREIVHVQTRHGLLDQLENDCITGAHGAGCGGAAGGGHGGSSNIVVHIEQARA
jgi:hypothetical protein